MDHPCSKCGVTVQDGIAFCPNCGAPQIRVANPFGDTPVTPPMPPGTPGEVQPPAEPITPWPTQQQGFRSPMQYDWRAGWRAAITVGVVMGMFSETPALERFCCLWTIAAGCVAIFLYRRNAGVAVVPVSLGFRTGAITGVIGFAIKAVFAVFHLMLRGGVEERQALRETIQRSLERSPDPQAQEMIRRIGDWM